MFHKVKHLPICCEALIALARARFLLWTGPLACAAAQHTIGFSLCTSLKPNKIAWAITRIAPLIPRSTCLVRAIAAHDLLTRHGHASTIHIGVAKSEANAFEAHAWVECNGVILVGRTDTQYTPLLNWSAATQ